MSELFCQDGHLSDAGLSALVAETLDEMERLEAAEHLSFCDKCLERYTLLLVDEALQEPPAPLRAPVQRRLRQKTRRVLLSRYATVAAAAVLAVGLFTGGTLLTGGFGGSNTTPAGARANTSQTGAPSVGITGRVNNAMDNVTGSVNGFFNGLFSGGRTQSPTEEAPKQDSPTEEDDTRTPREQERERREGLFEED